MLGIIAAVIIAFLSMFIPGALLAFGLLKKTELHTFEIIIIGFIFGLIAPATMTWLESYLITYIPALTFSLWLFELNAFILTIIGLVIAWREGILMDMIAYPKKLMGSFGSSGRTSELASIRAELGKYGKGSEIILRHQEADRALRAKLDSELSVPNLTAEQKETIESSHRSSVTAMTKSHITEEKALLEEQQGAKYKDSGIKPHWAVWAILLVIMLVTFYTRMQSIGTAPKFFEFDPYYDMIDTHYILTYGKQLLLDPSAWPVVAGGVNHRIEPIVPYLEAYWYSLINVIKFHYSVFNSTLMSYVGGIYPPITAALLVFIVFMLLYHEYDEKIGLIGAMLTAAMPTLITTFIAGEQLVEPWGIMALFFFIAAYMLAVRNMKSKRLAIFAGLAFVSSFLGAHYYTVTTGVLAIYIIVQGSIELARKGTEINKDFYTMNAIVIIIIAVFLAVFLPYQSTLQNRVPSILGIPFTLSAPMFSLILIFVINYLMKMAKERNIFLDGKGWTKNLVFLVAAYIVVTILIFVSPVRTSINNYINLSAKFTTPSKPLFMTVQEYIPTGLLYPFGPQGFGTIGASLLGLPVLVWIVCALALILIIMSILLRDSKTGVLYLAVAIPLMVAGFLEVKYLPHFGVAYIMLFCIILGELLYVIQSRNKFDELKKHDRISPSVYVNHRVAAYTVLFIGLFFVFGALAAIGLVVCIVYMYTKSNSFSSDSKKLLALAIALLVVAALWPTFRLGESNAISGMFRAAYVVSANPSDYCTILSNNGNGLGSSVYCNTIPTYWLSAMSWINSNVGPYAPRVLAWWDYGDWINWFGNSNAVLRGDNAVAQEDYAVAAQYILGPKYNATPQSLAQYMNGNQSKYVLFDQDLISKWGALNFLGCVNVNATSMQFAIAQGKLSRPAAPYALGNSNCEQQHDPQYALVPLSVLVNSTSSQNIGDYCSISNQTTVFFTAILLVGDSLNGTSCVRAPDYTGLQNETGVFQMYNTTGTKLNAVINENQILGVQTINNTEYVVFIMIYLPNGPNGTITDAPSQFYTSNYYRGFFTGVLPGFKQVYPNYQNGTNFANFSDPIRIWEVVNYTGGTPEVPPKPSYIHNNDTMP